MGGTTNSTLPSATSHRHDRYLRHHHHHHHLRKGPSSSDATKLDRAVWMGRILVVVVLTFVAVLLGYLAFFLLTSYETELAEKQFVSFANRALVEATSIANQRRRAAYTMASIVSEMFPVAESWPFVIVPGYERIVNDLLNATKGKDMGFEPFITPEILPEWEAFAYQFYETGRVPPFPNGTAVSSFGKGVWAVDPTLNTTDNRYHDTTGETTWGSPNRILTPVFSVDEGPNNKVLMLNLHAAELRGRTIDDMIACSRERHSMAVAAAAETNADPPVTLPSEASCGTVTPVVQTLKYNNAYGAIIYSPIHPARNHTTITGMISTVILFEEVLDNIFADEVEGVDCVLEIETTGQLQAVTYTIRKGVAYLVGKGDHHNGKHNKLRKESMLLDRSWYTNTSSTYRMVVYPNDDLYTVYRTPNPVIATIGSLLIILLTSLVFFLYDSFVRRDFSAKKDLLHAKRQFMRFVSHEVRTPLNSVSMGLVLLQTELAELLGYKSPDQVPDHKETTEEEKTKKLDEQGNASSITKDRAKTLDCFHLSHEIETNIQSAVGVLNDLLNYDKIQHGVLMLELSLVPVWQLIDRIVNEFKLPAAMKKIRLDCVFKAAAAADGTEKIKADEEAPGKGSRWELPDEAQSLVFVGDAVRISQVLRNLISNALKFTPENGSVCVVGTCHSPKKIKSDGDDNEEAWQTIQLNGTKTVQGIPSGDLWLSVKDSGVGLTEEQQKKLFREGIQFNVNELQAGQGSGLGLYITKGIVEQHGGMLLAESQGLGKGTLFTMTLPLWHVPDETLHDGGMGGPRRSGGGGENVRVMMQHAASDAQDDFAPIRVLVVDDVATNRKLLKRLLQKRGHVVDEAEDGAVAVEMVSKSMRMATVNNSKDDNNNCCEPYDSIVMDYEMPVMNGPKAVEEIRRMGSDMYIVGITGNVLPDDVHYFKSCGANAVLPKPLNMGDLERLWMEYGIVGTTCKSSEEE